MQVALCAMLALFTLLTALGVLRHRRPETLRAYLSFAPEHSLKHVRNTFEASNITFNTSFVAFFLFSFSLGFMTLWMALGFALSILFYARWLLPRHLSITAEGVRLPLFLSRLTGKRWLGFCAAALMLLSFSLYYHVELQGFHLFMDLAIPRAGDASMLLKLLLSLTLGWYIFRGGFQNVVQTDWLQLGCIRLGTLALYLMIGVLAIQHWDALSNPAAWHLTSLLAQPGFALQTLAGFLFGQLLYYENWLRLSLYFEAHREHLDDWRPIYQRMLYRSAGTTLWVLLGPICLGLLAAQLRLVEPGPAGLVQLLQQLWHSHVFFAGCICLLFLQLVAALVSTLDTFCISSAALILEEFCGIPLDSQDPGHLRLARWLSAGLVGLGFASTLLVVNIELAFIYLVYSVNGFVGPLLWGLFRAHQPLPAWVAVAAMVSGFTFPMLALLSPYPWLFDYAGLINLVLSLGLVWLLTPRTQVAEASR